MSRIGAQRGNPLKSPPKHHERVTREEARNAAEMVQQAGPVIAGLTGGNGGALAALANVMTVFDTATEVSVVVNGEHLLKVTVDG